MQREDVERLAAHYDERVQQHDGVADLMPNLRSERGKLTRDVHAQTAAALRALLEERDALIAARDMLGRFWSRAEAERDAAFAAGQEEMRERAAKDVAEFGRLYLRNGDDVTVDVVKDIRSLPIKDKPE